MDEEKIRDGSRSTIVNRVYNISAPLGLIPPPFFLSHTRSPLSTAESLRDLRIYEIL